MSDHGCASGNNYHALLAIQFSITACYADLYMKHTWMAYHAAQPCVLFQLISKTYAKHVVQDHTAEPAADLEGPLCCSEVRGKPVAQLLGLFHICLAGYP